MSRTETALSIERDPSVDQWYRPLDKGRQFQVTAIDEEAGTVEIQYFDGDVEELDLSGWRELELEPIEPPEDWTGAMDDVERDDLGYTETDMTEEEWTETGREKAGRRRYEGEEPEEREDEG